MPEAALTPFTACDAYRYFAGRALLILLLLQVRRQLNTE